MEPIKHEQRVEIKKRAKDVVRSHFILLVIICLVVSYYGTDLNFVTDNVDTLWKLVTGQPIEFGDDSLKIDKSKTSDKVLQDLIDDNYKAGKTHAAIQLEEYRQEKLTNDVNSRKNGIFAAVANNISSGNLYMIIFEGLHSVIHSTRVTSAIIVFFSMMAAIALWIFIKNMLGAIMRRVFLEARLYKTVPVSHMLHFKLVKRWFRASMTLLLTTIFQYLWFITVIGGFIKMYSYRMVPFIVAENPDLKPREAITLSRRMMNGHKWQAFKLDLSFFGWILLGALTLGLVNVFWTVPYMESAQAALYLKLRDAA